MIKSGLVSIFFMLIIYIKISCVLEKGDNSDQTEMMHIDLYLCFYLLSHILLK